MEKIFFPHEFLVRGAVADLNSEAKFFLVAIATHKTTSACGVTTLTEFFAKTASMDLAFARGRAADAVERGDVVFDAATGEVFLVAWFSWHRAPAAAGADPWSRQIAAAIAAIRSASVREAVLAAIAAAPPARLAAVAVPTNLFSALPARRDGGRWALSDLLVFVAAFAGPSQTPAGTAVVDLDEMGAVCSLPPATVGESFATLARAGALVWDAVSREIFVARRLRAATVRDGKAIADAVAGARSRRVRAAIRGELSRTFPELSRTPAKKSNKTAASAPVDVDVDWEGKGESARPRLRAALAELAADAAARKTGPGDDFRNAEAARKALGEAAKLGVPDAAAAAAIASLRERRGWPREAAGAIRAAALEAAERQRLAALQAEADGTPLLFPPLGGEAA